MKILISLLEGTSVFLVISYAYCWAPALPPLEAGPLRPRSKLTMFLFFSAVSIMGSYLGMREPGGSLANNRAVGSVLAGLMGGPVLGMLVGATAGAHRMVLGGFTALSGATATTMEGLLAGLVHLSLRRSRPEKLLHWRTAALTTAVGETLHMCLVLLISRPYPNALASVKIIGPPMILSNSIGAALFMRVLQDRQEVYDKIASASSALALKVAERTLGLMAKGFGRGVAGEMARIIREETGVGAVGITDTEKIMAFDGLGSDHHTPGRAIFSPLTHRALAANDVVFADGIHEQFDCPIAKGCPLHSAIVVPLQIDGKVVGTVQLYEPEARHFRTLNRSLGEGIGALLSSQLVLTRYQEQKSLLVTSELKLLQAQVNPHFLFNSLNTIVAVTRTDPDRARELLIHLSHFFRKNLKRSTDVSTLQEELEHVSAYLEIEKARFRERLHVETDVDPSLLTLRVPTFTLQPLIENAIRHGISTTLSQGKARIHAYRKDGNAIIEIEDNAGAYTAPDHAHNGLGMRIVDKRIKNLLGEAFGVSVECVPQELTRVTVRLPAEGLPAEVARR
ncbi:MAG: LytS/YhcK type 5TM receptor domain-containing protein [Anaeromyxobacteraceae bacterium]